jgi:hypothetical protein
MARLGPLCKGPCATLPTGLWAPGRPAGAGLSPTNRCEC